MAPVAGEKDTLMRSAKCRGRREGPSEHRELSKGPGQRAWARLTPPYHPLSPLGRENPPVTIHFQVQSVSLILGSTAEQSPLQPSG